MLMMTMFSNIVPDDAHSMSEGVFDDATMTSPMEVANLAPVPETGTVQALMTSPADDVMMVASSADDPVESHVVMSSGDDVMMISNTDI